MKKILIIDEANETVLIGTPQDDGSVDYQTFTPDDGGILDTELDLHTEADIAIAKDELIELRELDESSEVYLLDEKNDINVETASVQEEDLEDTPKFQSWLKETYGHMDEDNSNFPLLPSLKTEFRQYLRKEAN